MIEYSYLPNTLWITAIGCGAAALIFASYFWARGRASRGIRAILGMVRWVIVGAVILCLVDPEWVESVKHQQKSRLAVLLDTSKSMGIKDLPGERLSAAKTWLQTHVTPAVPPEFSVQYYSFSNSVVPLGSMDRAAADGESTGLANALDEVLAQPGDEPLTGVLLCSDGIENLRKDVEGVARLYRRKGIPIHTLTVGTTNDTRDIVVENAQVRRAVPNQAPTKVTVTVRAPGFEQQTVPLQIFHGTEMVAMKEIQLGKESQRYDLEFTPRQKGFQVYEVRVPQQKEEWLTTNNRRAFGLEVIDPTIRVLYMEGTPQQPNSTLPEWKYLKSALESDPNIKVKTLYREFGATGKRLHTVDTDPETGEKIYPVEHPTRGFPQTLNALLEYDVVIHSDIRKESFTGEELRNIQRLVEEFGGGFVMIGGNSAFGKGGYHKTILDRIIPVAMRQENDSQARPFQLHIPATSWDHPVIALGANRQQTEFIWNRRLPLLYGYNLVDRAKPGATVLADDPSSTTVGGSRLVLAVQSIGQGRTMAFTSDTTRTWGKDFETLWGEKINPSQPLTEENCDSRYYRQFWVNAVRWLAAGRMSRTNSAVTLELAQSYCAPNEKVAATIKVRDRALKEIPMAEVIVLVASGGITNTVAKPAFDSASRSYTAEFSLPEAGEFTVTAVATVRGRAMGDDRQLLVCEGVDREMKDLRARTGLMQNIAKLSGGQSLSVNDSDPAPVRAFFYNAPPVTVEFRRNPLWDRSWWLAAILALLTAEWAVRRVKGMA